MMWINVERPGQTGFKGKELIEKRDQLYGKGNWRIAHVYNEQVLLKPEVFYICELAYYHHSLKNPELWKKLTEEAKDIYDMKPEETESGLDYNKQHEFTRFHDICIRNVVLKRGWTFKGDKIIQIRYDEKNPNWYNQNFDPGKVPFHEPEYIIKPSLKGWWDENSVEDFYQSNKVLQKKYDD